MGSDASLSCEGSSEHHDQHAPLTTLMALAHTIQQRRLDMQQQTGGELASFSAANIIAVVCTVRDLTTADWRAGCLLALLRVSGTAQHGYRRKCRKDTSTETPPRALCWLLLLSLPQVASPPGQPSCCQTQSCCAKR